MFLRLLFWGLFLSVILPSRSEELQSDRKPSAVAIDLVNAMRVGDIPALRNLVTPESLPDLEHLPQRASTAGEPELVEEKIEGERAIVSLLIPLQGTTNRRREKIPLTRINAEWRVDFVTLMKEVRPKAARAAVNNFHNHLIFYRAKEKSLPTMEQGLKALTEAPQNSPFPQERRPLMDKIPLDPWGHAYRYEIPAKRNKGGEFDVFSIGPDKQPNTDDDIGNW